MGSKSFQNAHYVALSRATTKKGLNFLRLSDETIRVSNQVKEEMVRLRTNKTMQLCYTPLYTLPSDNIILHFKMHAHTTNIIMNCIQIIT